MEEKKKRSSENERPRSGIAIPTNSPLGVPRLSRADLTSTDSLRALYERLTVRRVLPATEQAWVWLIAVVERAHRKRSRNPARWVGWALNHSEDVHLSSDDEEAAGARLREWKAGGLLVTPEDGGGPQKPAQGSGQGGSKPALLGDLLRGAKR